MIDLAEIRTCTGPCRDLNGEAVQGEFPWRSPTARTLLAPACSLDDMRSHPTLLRSVETLHRAAPER